MLIQNRMMVSTSGRKLTEITRQINDLVIQSDIKTGLCHVFLQHTSASIILCENADPSVRHDLEAFMARLIIDKSNHYTHTSEGADDMPAHIRTVLTQTDMLLPVTDGRLALGTWQGIYIWEHRYSRHQRNLVVTIQA